MATTITSVNSTTSSTLLIAADGTRTSLTIQNTDAGTLFCSVGVTPATTAIGGFTFSRVLNASATLTPPESYQAIYGIWSADGSGGATITAITDPVSDSNGAFSTFSGLKTAIIAWLRPNSSATSDMTTNIPKYVGLAEVMIRRELHLRAMDQTEASLTIDDGTASVPTGFQAVLSMALTDDPYNQVRALPLDQLQKLDPTNATDKPFYYARSGSLFRFYPRTDATAQLIYRRNLTPLSADDDTNWLLAGHPDVYLYGSLIHADRRLIGPRLGEWKEGFEQALNSIKMLEINIHQDAIYPQPSGFVV
jgi:hypothetical protein